MPTKRTEAARLGRAHQQRRPHVHADDEHAFHHRTLPERVEREHHERDVDDRERARRRRCTGRGGVADPSGA